MYHMIGSQTSTSRGVTTLKKSDMWHAIEKDELYNSNADSLKGQYLYRGDIDVVQKYLVNGVTTDSSGTYIVPSLLQKIEEERNGYIMPDIEKCTEAEESDSAICQCSDGTFVNPIQISPCNYTKDVPEEAKNYWKKVQEYLEEQFADLL